MSEQATNCPVCLDAILPDKCGTLPCGHKFHLGCISEWVVQHYRDGANVPSRCPVCRRSTESTREHGDLLSQLGRQELLRLVRDKVLPKERALQEEAQRIQRSLEYHRSFCPLHNGSFQVSPVLWIGTQFQMTEEARFDVFNTAFESLESVGQGSSNLSVVFHVQS